MITHQRNSRSPLIPPRLPRFPVHTNQMLEHQWLGSGKGFQQRLPEYTYSHRPTSSKDAKLELAVDEMVVVTIGQNRNGPAIPIGITYVSMRIEIVTGVV